MTAPVATDTVSVTIDGVVVSVPKGTMLIEAAKRAGIVVPHYCYHPSLPSPAVCRMCLVQIEKFPKMVPSCVTPAVEGQVVRVHSPEAIKARKGVLEFLLINHPLDCPICDQAGECELQDFVFQEGQSGTRYADYPKRYNPVEDFGSDVLYVANRCILCTRCVRFMEDVAEEPVLAVAERGDRAYIALDQSQRLEHPWAGNVVDLCPVGSLISKDFLHKARAWDLDKTPSVCSGCSQGCNTTIDTRDETVVRLRPRPNLEVNRHFICDTGRADYRWMNRGDRAEQAMLGGQPVEWDVALDQLAAMVAETAGTVVLLAGRRVSTETLGWARRLLDGRQVNAAVLFPRGDEAPLAGIPNLALRAERAANLEGARMLGYSDDGDAALAAAANATLVILLDAELTDTQATQLSRADRLVHFATSADPRLGNTALLLPITSMAEEQGVYVNRDGRAQRFMPARPAPGMARPAWWAAAEAWRRGGEDRRTPSTASEAFAALTPFAGMTHRELGYNGLVVATAAQGAA